MATKSKPKLSDSIESVFKVIKSLKEEVSRHNNNLEDSISKIDNIESRIDFDRILNTTESFEKNINQLLIRFTARVSSSHDNLLDRIKRFHSMMYYYLIVLNFILVITLGFALFKVESKSSQVDDYEKFLNENSESFDQYKSWLENN